MQLSKNLVTEFVKITNAQSKPKNETMVYGNVVKNGESTYVQLDGSDILTPVLTTADTHNGERVTVLIKNHTATVTGNISSPAARTGDVQQLGESKLDAASAEITYATIANLEATNVKVDKFETSFIVESDKITISSPGNVTINATSLNDSHGIFLSVVEGASGIWKYKKWSNGDVELWGTHTVSNIACSNSFGDSMYRSDAISMPSFPFNIYGANLTACYESDGYGAFLLAVTTTTETSPPSYYLVMVANDTIASGKINFHVIGKWTN